MFVLILMIHILVSLVLIGVILLQGGRGGLSEVMSGGMAQSLFGGSATSVLTRMTAICAGIFVVTCLSLAYLSTAQGRSVMEQVPMTLPEVLPEPLAPVPTDRPIEPSSIQPEEADGSASVGTSSPPRAAGPPARLPADSSAPVTQTPVPE